MFSPVRSGTYLRRSLPAPTVPSWSGASRERTATAATAAAECRTGCLENLNLYAKANEKPLFGDGLFLALLHYSQKIITQCIRRQMQVKGIF